MSNESESSKPTAKASFPPPAKYSPLTALFFTLISIAFIGGIVINLSLFRQNQAAAKEPEVVETLAPTPAPTPPPTPTVNSVKVYAFGRELGEDGFTAYVGDRAFTLSVSVDPEIRHPRVEWSMSDSSSAYLTVSSDGLSCEFSAQKPTGKNELTVRCYGAETVIPVYLWER